MSRIIAFCSVEELKNNLHVTKWIDELRDELTAFYVQDQILVYSTVCPHFGGDFLCDHKNAVLTCKWHGWKFDLKTGKSLTDIKDYECGSLIRALIDEERLQLGCFPFKGKLATYQHRITNDTLEVVLP